MRSVFIGLILMWMVAVAQAQPDSLVRYTYQDYIAQVKQHHPMVVQAELRLKAGDAELLKARGTADPKLQGDVRQKYFEGTTYYQYTDASVQIPTFYGIAFDGGYQFANGVYISDERTTPEDGLWRAGVTLDVGNGLLMNERRAALQQAKILQDASVLERRLLRNALVYDATVAYWEWFGAYHLAKVYREAEVNAVERAVAVKEAFVLGDKPAIDTVEAGIQVQIIQSKRIAAEAKAMNNRAKMQVFLWQDGFIPLVLKEEYAPPEIDAELFEIPEASAQGISDERLQSHPEILMARYKLDGQRVDLKLKKEQLKPVVQLKYNALSDVENGFAFEPQDNYTWGAKISYPIFTRKERGAVRLAEVKTESLEADLAFKTAKLKYEITASINNLNASYAQVVLGQSTVRDYRELVDAERQLFALGESALFMINTREKNYLMAQESYIHNITANVLSKTWLDYQLVLLD